MIRRTACLVARGVDPYRNLAIEKHLMDTLPEDTAILYLWQNQHTIVIGRNQNPRAELRVEEFLRSGGRIARRLSGGGAVYHDLGNLNFTFVVPKADFDIPRQLSAVALAVSAFGVKVQASGRNDLHAQGRKFSGNAFYKAGAAAYHHGTLLVDSDTDSMARFLTVDEKKLEGRGVPSVPARVVNLCQLCPSLTVDALQNAMCAAFARVYGAQPAWLDERMLDQASLARWTEWFSSEDWLFPDEPDATFDVSERFPWGGVTVRLAVEGGVIQRARMYTDAMEAALFTRMEQMLERTPFLISAIAGRFDQRLSEMTDPRLAQMAGDVCTLICGCIRDQNRRQA